IYMTTESASIPSRSARLRTPSAWPAVALTVDTLLSDVAPASCCRRLTHRYRVVHTLGAPRASGAPYCEDTASSAQKGAGTLLNRFLGHEQVPGGLSERQIGVDRRDPLRGSDVTRIDEGRE